jgi:selenocysteine lyase/cysteine desulfurase
VAFSLVQSASGAIADLEAIVAAAAHVGATTVVDATQACGWLPVDGSRVDALVCGTYKWLLSPRGTAFMVTTPQLRERIVPSQSGWWAGEDPHTSYYGPPLRLAADARRLNISPAWFNWVAAAPALELIEQVGVEEICAHNVALANRFRAGLGLPSGNSAIVSVDVPGAEERLAAAGVRAAVRGGRMRASFHLYTTQADVDLALAALTG